MTVRVAEGALVDVLVEFGLGVAEGLALVAVRVGVRVRVGVALGLEGTVLENDGVTVGVLVRVTVRLDVGVEVLVGVRTVAVAVGGRVGV